MCANQLNAFICVKKLPENSKFEMSEKLPEPEWTWGRFGMSRKLHVQPFSAFKT